MTSPVNKVVDACYVINLKQRPKRYATVAARLQRHHIQFERFDAVDGYAEELIKRVDTLKRELGRQWHFNDTAHAPRRYACLQSHMKLWKHALAQGHKRVLVLEDDVMLHSQFNMLLSKALNSLPCQDWKVLLLGANHNRIYGERPSSEANRYWYRCATHVFGAFAYMLTDDAMRELIAKAERTFGAQDVHVMAPYYRANPGKCWVAQPNLIIAQVEQSDLRRGVSQAQFASSRGWDLTKFATE